MTQNAQAALEQTLTTQVEALMDTLSAIEDETTYNAMIARFLTPDLSERLTNALNDEKLDEEDTKTPEETYEVELGGDTFEEKLQEVILENEETPTKVFTCETCQNPDGKSVHHIECSNCKARFYLCADCEKNDFCPYCPPEPEVIDPTVFQTVESYVEASPALLTVEEEYIGSPQWLKDLSAFVPDAEEQELSLTERKEIDAILMSAMEQQLELERKQTSFIKQEPLLSYSKQPVSFVDVTFESPVLCSEAQWLWWFNQRTLLSGFGVEEVFWSKRHEHCGASRTVTARFSTGNFSLSAIKPPFKKGESYPFDPLQPSHSISVINVKSYSTNTSNQHTSRVDKPNSFIERLKSLKFLKKFFWWLEECELERELARKKRKTISRYDNVRGIG